MVNNQDLLYVDDAFKNSVFGSAIYCMMNGEWSRFIVWWMKDERWKMKDERWKMKDERWKMKDERWKMNNKW
jgi:hypothetical protein